MMWNVEAARGKYKPKKPIKVLFIAEAPPDSPDRFFYYEDVNTHDWLYLGMMKILYGDYDVDALRLTKKIYLTRFSNDGFYLIDASTEPMPSEAHGREKEKKLTAALSDLIYRLQQLEQEGCISKSTPIILIAAPVFYACQKDLKAAGYNVVNDEAIYFPASGRQGEFETQMQPLLDRLGLAPAGPQ